MQRLAHARAQKLGRLFFYLCGGIVAGYLLLIAVYAIPTESIAHHVKISVPALDGSWETGEIQYEQLVKGYLTTQLDNTTDACMLLAAAHPNDQPLWQRAINGAQVRVSGGAFKTLRAFGQDDTATFYTVYSARYWHGYLVWLKPLLTFFSYMDIRILMMMVQTLLIAMVAVGLGRRGLARYAPAFALSLLCLTPAITGFSMQFSTVMTVLLVAMGVLLYCPRCTGSRFHTAVFFMLTGMATSYFDYLTYPMATFGMPYVLYLVIRPPETRKMALAQLAGCLAVWCGGYFGMWAGKWLLAFLLSSDPWFVANLEAKIAERSSLISQGTAIGILDVLRVVLGVFVKRAYAFVGGLVVLGYGALWFTLGRRVRGVAPTVSGGNPALAVLRKRRAALTLALLLTAVLPFGWYVAAANHSYNHAFFTSRALAVTVFAVGVLAAAWLPKVQQAATQGGIPKG